MIRTLVTAGLFAVFASCATAPAPVVRATPMTEDQIAEKTLGPPSEFEKRCLAGEDDACFQLTLAAARTAVKATSAAPSRAVLRRACSAGQLLSCQLLANVSREIDALALACSTPSELCFELARSLPGEAATHQLDWLCDSPSPVQKLGCATFAERLTAPNRLGDKIAALDMACALKDARSCRELSQLWLSPEAPRLDRTRARLFQQRACVIDGASCDDELSQLESLCRKGSAEACFDHGRRFAQFQSRQPVSPSDYATALNSLKTACDKRHGAACASMGSLLEQGRGTDKNLEAAIDAQRRACSLGFKSACGAADDLVKERAACERKSQPQCSAWVAHYFEPYSTLNDQDRGISALRRARSLQNESACHELVDRAYEKGRRQINTRND